MRQAGKWHSIVFKVDGDWASNPYDNRFDAYQDAMNEYDHASIGENDIHYIAVVHVPFGSTLEAAMRQDPEKTWGVKDI